MVVFSNVIGNFSLSRGMRGTDPRVFDSPLGYIEVLFNPWVAAGVCLLLLWMFSQMALLSWADLSYVLPVTSIGYVLSAVAGRVFLHEQISPARWIGVLPDHDWSGPGGPHHPQHHCGARPMNWLLVAIVVGATTIKDILQAIVMKRHGEIHDFRPGALGRVLGCWRETGSSSCRWSARASRSSPSSAWSRPPT